MNHKFFFDQKLLSFKSFKLSHIVVRVDSVYNQQQ